MEAPSSWAVLVLAWLAAALALLPKIIKFRRHRKLKYPPGPKPWPIVGNLNHLVGSIPHRSLHVLSKKYGEIMQLRLGSFPVVVASSPEMAKEFLKTHGQAFASRPATAAGKYNSHNFSDMTWAPYGPYWRQARKIYLNELFSVKRLDSYEYIRVDERCAMMSRLFALSGEIIVIKEHLTRFTLANISRMALGDKYFSTNTETKCDDDENGLMVRLEELQDMLDEWFLLGGVFNIGDWIPWLGFLDLQGYVKRMKALVKKFDRFHNCVIEDHKARKEATNLCTKDMVDVIFQLADDSNLEVKFTCTHIKGLL